MRLHQTRSVRQVAPPTHTVSQATTLSSSVATVAAASRSHEDSTPLSASLRPGDGLLSLVVLIIIIMFTIIIIIIISSSSSSGSISMCVYVLISIYLSIYLYIYIYIYVYASLSMTASVYLRDTLYT